MSPDVGKKPAQARERRPATLEIPASRAWARVLGGLAGFTWGCILSYAILFGAYGPHSPLVLVFMLCFWGSIGSFLGIAFAVPRGSVARTGLLMALLGFVVAFGGVFVLARSAACYHAATKPSDLR